LPYVVDLPALCTDATKVDVVVSWMYLGDITNDDLGAPSGTPAPPPSTTTTTSVTPPPPTSGPASAEAFSAGSPLIVASFLGLLVGSGRTLSNRRSKRNR
jgi:hypothetical protein